MSRESIPPLHESIKKIAFNLINSMYMCDIKYGTVVGVNPLRIKIDEQEPLREESLVLSNMVKDHAVDITVSMKTVDDNYLKPDHTHGNGNNGSSTTTTPNFDTTHHHDIKGKKKIIMHYGLTVGESVILIRTQGAKKYIVLDRIGIPPTDGEYL